MQLALQLAFTRMHQIIKDIQYYYYCYTTLRVQKGEGVGPPDSKSHTVHPIDHFWISSNTSISSFAICAMTFRAASDFDDDAGSQAEQ
jgi:hypothetical protein